VVSPTSEATGPVARPSAAPTTRSLAPVSWPGDKLDRGATAAIEE